jgi:Protein of unknown function (DUF1592)/Protein of unknown function (DUF1588)/Protein of unknown function (DUF1585)
MRAARLLSAALLCGCTAELGAPGQSDGGTWPLEDAFNPALAPERVHGAVAADLSITRSCSPTTLRGAAYEGVSRLTKVQLERLLQAAFPDLFRFSSASYPNYYKPVTPVMARYPAEVPSDPNEHFEPMHDEAQVRAWMNVADEFGVLVAASPPSLARYGGACMNAPTRDPDCWRGFVAKLGRTLYRRPLADDELDRVLALGPDDDEPARIRVAVAFLLRSPHAVFHMVQGTPDASGRTRLNAFEVASRLSFALTDAPPDEELARAAEAGELDDLVALRAHAMRLLETPLARVRLRSFVAEWLRTADISRPPQLAAHRYDWPANTLRIEEEFRQEIEQYAVSIIWDRHGTLRDLLTAPIAMPIGAKVAQIYGVEPTTVGGPARDAPDHPGILLRAGLLSSGTMQTNPILRGVTVLRRALCQALPSPDATIVATRVAQLDEVDPRSVASYEAAHELTRTEPCTACHSMINPVGFALETYDHVGARRDMSEYAYAEGGEVHIASFPLPGPQAVTLGTMASTISAPEELVERLAETPEVSECFATRLLRARARRPESSPDACALAETAAALRADLPLLDVLADSIVNEDLFWKEAP